MRLKLFFITILVAACTVLSPKGALAGYFELSTGFSYNRTNYTGSDYDWTRRWGGGFGFHFTDQSEIEFSYSNATSRTFITGYQDTTMKDRVYSVSWVQNLYAKDFPVQPYLKVGAGQLYRDISGTYGLQPAPTSRVESLTVILGGGLRIFLMRNFAIRGEATSYLNGGRISTWKDNVSVTLGTSLYF